MKRIFLYAAIAGTITLSACSDFLEVEPVGSIGVSSLLDQNGIEQVTNGMYATLYNNDNFAGNLTNYQYGDVLAGDANKGSTFNDQSSFTNFEVYQITTDNSYFNSKWSNVYQGVHRSNYVIDMANQAKAAGSISDELYNRVIAEAHFFRGFWHFEGIRVFGAAIPYVSQEDYLASVSPQVSNVDESGNYIYIWDKTLADLEYAYNNLPSNWTATGDYGRVNKWAAAAYIAKLKMYWSSPYNGTNATSNKWEEVKSMIETIMANGEDAKGQKYRLADTYETLVLAGESDWTGESVFDIQNTIVSTQTVTNAIYGSSHIAPPGALSQGGWGFYQPSYNMANAHIVDANGLPYLNGEYRDFPTVTQLTANGPVTDLTRYTDPRLDVSVGRFDVPYYDWAIPTALSTGSWIRDTGNGGVYVNKKYMPRKRDKGSLSSSTSAGSSAKNTHLIRYADVLLWYAEALIETGNPGAALEYVNMVRARAAKGYIKAADPATMEETTSSYVFEDLVNGTTKANAAANYRLGLWPASQFATKEGATAALRYERRMELGLEGHRWFDLCRWGVVYDEVTDYIAYEKQYLPKFQRSVYDKAWVTLPIPYNQILVMQGALVQNENWK